MASSVAVVPAAAAMAPGHKAPVKHAQIAPVHAAKDTIEAWPAAVAKSVHNLQVRSQALPPPHRKLCCVAF